MRLQLDTAACHPYTTLLAYTLALLASTAHALYHPNGTLPYPTNAPLPNATSSSSPVQTSAATCGQYWLQLMPHVGKAPSNNDPNYKIFRNVKDAPYNAKGDGQTDDTDAINRAINDTSRCGPNVCQSSTTSPAIVYLPYGTYLISAPLIMYYYTQVSRDVLLKAIPINVDNRSSATRTRNVCLPSRPRRTSTRAPILMQEMIERQIGHRV